MIGSENTEQTKVKLLLRFKKMGFCAFERVSKYDERQRF